MARLTTLQISQLDNMNVSSQRAGGLGTRLDAIQYGSVTTPSVGTLTPMRAVKYSTTPAVGTATYVHAAVTLGAAAQDVTTAIADPDFPRIVTVKSNASGITNDVVITGTDINGTAITDTIALSGASEVLGVKAFKTVTNINLPAKTNGSGDTVSVGVGNKIGFPVAIPNASLCFAKSFNGTVDSSTITAASTVAGSLAAVAGTFDGSKVYDLYFFA